MLDNHSVTHQILNRRKIVLLFFQIELMKMITKIILVPAEYNFNTIIFLSGNSFLNYSLLKITLS
jgi:hypothetical protein